MRMNIITTEFQRRDQDTRWDDSKDRRKKRTFEDRIPLQKALSDKYMKSCCNRNIVPQEQMAGRRKAAASCTAGKTTKRRNANMVRNSKWQHASIVVTTTKAR